MGLSVAATAAVGGIGGGMTGKEERLGRGGGGASVVGMPVELLELARAIEVQGLQKRTRVAVSPEEVEDVGQSRGGGGGGGSVSDPDSDPPYVSPILTDEEGALPIEQVCWDETVETDMRISFLVPSHWECSCKRVQQRGKITFVVSLYCRKAKDSDTSEFHPQMRMVFERSSVPDPGASLQREIATMCSHAFSEWDPTTFRTIQLQGPQMLGFPPCEKRVTTEALMVDSFQNSLLSGLSLRIVTEYVHCHFEFRVSQLYRSSFSVDRELFLKMVHSVCIWES